ncbi:MAG TPA: NAD-dependent epimerase/dehydratase family protein [Thermomicrobiales bacterium]|nr:NAD-dependent epimerase/dehydratase family protein [Thermomicrobiales bacterium]
MELKGAKVVVVGGAGLIGSHVVDRLTHEDAREIVVYDNFTRGTLGNLDGAMRDPRVRIYELGGDILHTDILEKALEGADVVFHLAALWLLHCHEFPQSAFEVNIRGTFNVLEACRKQKVGKLVYSSSASVYGDAVAIPMEEDHPYNNRTFYGATKIAGEHMARAHHHRYGLDYVGLRYMNIYGPRQDYMGAYVAVVMKILDRIDRGEPPIVYGDGTQSYDFIYVEDAAECNVLAAKSAATDRFYNVGMGEPTTIREICELLLDLTDSRHLGIQYEPAGQTFVTQRLGSISAAERDLGFRAGTPLEEGLRRLIAWRAAHKEAVADRIAAAQARAG